MKTIILAVLTLASTLSLAGNGIYGTWKLGEYPVGAMTITATVKFETDKATATSTCVMGGATETVSVTVPAKITATHVSLLDVAEKRDSSAGFDCNVGISKAEADYTVSADDQTLTLNTDQGPLVLPRVN